MRLLEPGAGVILWLSLFAVCRGQVPIKQRSGTDVTFKVVTSENPSEINWFKENNKIVDLEQGRQPDFYQLADRVTASFADRTMILKNVSPADNGLYRAQLVVQGEVSYKDFRLQVYDPVCKVNITSTPEKNNITLRCACSGHGDRPSSYEWHSGEGRKPVSNSPNYTVSKTKEPQLFICVASNEISSEEARFIVPPEVPDDGGLSPGTIVGILFLIILLPVGVVCVLYRYRNWISEHIFRRRPTTDVKTKSETDPLKNGSGNMQNKDEEVVETEPEHSGPETPCVDQQTSSS